MKIGFLITARLKSSRLPLKLLLDLNGKSIFERVIDRCKQVSDVETIILCTSTNSQDKALVDLAFDNNIHYYLGDEIDVLKRLSDAASFFGLDYIINITGENPLFSIYHANLVVNQARKEKNDFIYIQGLPIGCAVYGIRPEALKVVCEVKQEIDTEIWGPLLNRPEIFNVKEIVVNNFYNRPELRITTDYIEDYIFIKTVYSQFSKDAIPDLLSVLELLKQNPYIEQTHSDRKQLALPIDVQKKINSFYTDNRDAVLSIKEKYYK